jgi:hypothetical protein
MPRYRVTLTRTTVEIVEATNPYQAAIAASSPGENGEILDVRPAVGRPTAATSKKSMKKAAKTRRPLSPQARAKLAKNLVKARAARAAKARAAKKRGQPTKAKATKVTKKARRPAKKKR